MKRLGVFVGNNIDTEAGFGIGAGGNYSSGSIDPNTGEFVRDPNFLWQAGGEIAISTAGGRAFNWAVQTFLKNTTTGQRLEAFRQLKTTVGGFTQFVATLVGNDKASKDQGLGIAMGMLLGAVYTKLVAERNDNVDYSTDVFSWAALQFRGKFSDQKIPYFGEYTGKAGGRIQLNFGNTLKVE